MMGDGMMMNDSRQFIDDLILLVYPFFCGDTTRCTPAWNADPQHQG